MKIRVTAVMILFIGMLVSGSVSFAGTLKSELPPNDGNIRGSVFDADTHEPLAAASVMLYRENDSIIYKGTTTDAEGGFVFENVAQGVYSLVVKFVGYETGSKQQVIIGEEKEVVLNDINLKPGGVSTDEVTVTGEKPMIEYKDGKQIINVDKSVTGSGGTALDVLKTAPSIEVDAQNNISLRGSSNIRILVDGKPTSISIENYTNLLEQIPASSLKNIELITNPSAKYDAEGVAGIINLVLAKEMEGGINGLLSLNAGTKDRYNTSLDINYNDQTFNYFGNYSFMQRHMNLDNTMTRRTTVSDTTFNLFQDSRMRQKFQMHNIKAGFDYNPSKQMVLTIYGVYRTNDIGLSWLTDYIEQEEFSAPQQIYYRNFQLDMPYNNYDIAVNWKKTFDTPNQEWTIDAYYSGFSIDFQGDYHTVQSTAQQNGNLFPQGFRNSRNQSDVGTTTLQTDYVHPLNENGDKIETGLKATLGSTDSDYRYQNLNDQTGLWEDDLTQNNNFVYHDNVYAAYMMYNASIDNFNYQAGLRAEATITSSEQKATGEEHDLDYIDLFPNLSLSYKMGMMDQIQFTYSRRINRPRVWSLNPYKDVSDPLNVRYGNPELKPEYTNSFELGYVAYIGKHVLMPTLFYRQTTDVISSYSFLDDEGVVNNTALNTGKGENYGLEMSYQASIFSWWSNSLNFSYYRQIIDPSHQGATGERDEYSWNGRINSNFILATNFSLQLFAMYRPETVTSQGKRGDMYFMDIAARWDIFDKAATVTLRVSDVFNTLEFWNSSTGPGYDIYNTFQPDYRTITLGFSYKINQGVKPRRDKENPDGVSAPESF